MQDTGERLCNVKPYTEAALLQTRTGTGSKIPGFIAEKALLLWTLGHIKTEP